MARRKKTKVREWLEAIIIALLLVLFVRTFVFEVFLIPTPSMEKTLMTGDFILVNKIKYGPRLPITPLSFPFSHQNLPFLKEYKSFLGFIKLPYFRFPGTGKIERNDVIVFNYPLEDEFPADQKTHFVKRCIALPGDTLLIREGNLQLNYKSLKNTGDVQYNYLIKTAAKDPDFIKNLEINEGGWADNGIYLKIPLTQKTAETLMEEKEIQEIKKWKEKEDVYYEHIFPHYPSFRWNVDNFGPVVIPEKGRTININILNLPIYSRIISEYEGNELNIEGESIFINGELANHYTFEMDYYFMMGDNRHYSSDSRYWGFVPADHIVGKAVMVIFSAKPDQGFFNKFRWERFFKIIS